jgi:hypothetical protein
MADPESGAGEQLAQWLKEAGQRARAATREAGAEPSDEHYNSPASLHRYVEELAGRKLQSHAEVLHFLREVAGSQPEAHAARERRRMVREIGLLVVLALSYLHYYYWEVQLEISKLNEVRTFIPAKAQPAKRQT